ncbi:MAG: BlaI/MecI/CopY family transcriptional regulator [Thermonemataceae bacterium]
MKDKKYKPTDSELDILQVLWQHGASSVRFVNEQINEKLEKKVGYTTTLKLLQILHEKGIVKRDESAKSHLYEAAISEQATQQALLDKFLNVTFKGSARDLVMQALGNKKTSKEELEEIRQFLDKLEGGKS